MPRTNVTTVDAYIAAQPEGARAALRHVRDIIRAAVPGADEGISYQIPVYRLHGALVLHFAGFKAHYSLYPATDGIVEALGDELAAHVVSKGTIRFSLAEPVPTRLIARIARFRARVARDRAASRVTATKARTAAGRPKPARVASRSKGQARAPR
jgi:uncharacterized protein YdhG (YjbR/CyaY superfamily)